MTVADSIDEVASRRLRRSRAVAELARRSRVGLSVPLSSDAVVSVEVSRQYRLVVTTVSGERYEVEVRREGERLFRMLAPSLARAIVLAPVGVPLCRRASRNGIEFCEAGR
jgi:hypothetical protein